MMLKTFYALCAFSVAGMLGFCLYFSCAIQPYRISGSSMFPSFKDGDVVLVERFFWHLFRPQSGDLVIFYHNNTKVIKRVLFTEHQTIHTNYQQALLWLDQPIFVADHVWQELQKNHYTLPQHTYFVIGDNPNASLDSRQYGFISDKQLIGRVLGVIHHS